ncbi:Uncharacterised protein [uncultured archaeon]|nr:Uncharacterised protein [uncultured archaeon]
MCYGIILLYEFLFSRSKNHKNTYPDINGQLMYMNQTDALIRPARRLGAASSRIPDGAVR